MYFMECIIYSLMILFPAWTAAGSMNFFCLVPEHFIPSISFLVR